MAVVRDGETIYKSGYGFANLEWRQPIGPDTVLGLGSVTKPFTAQAVLLLEQQGKLRLDDEITRYLPDAPTHGRQIIIAHLLTHTSGIANFVTQPGFWPNTAREERTPKEVTALFADLAPDFEPGETTATATPPMSCSAGSSRRSLVCPMGSSSNRPSSRRRE